MVVGQPGAGKSTFARALGHATGLPVVHIDREVHWLPGWVERPTAEKSRRCAEICARDAWIFEGGHSRTWPERVARADTLIWLDMPLPLRLWRVAKRTALHYGRSRPDLPKGCPEQFSLPFLRWIWDTRKTQRQRMAALVAAAPPHLDVHHLADRCAVDGFLGRLQQGPVPA